MTKPLCAVVFSMLTILLLTLCGCGAEPENTMTLDHTFSGSRVIDCTVSRGTLQNTLPEGEVSADFLLGQSCPSFLKWEKTQQGDTLLYRFTLSFDSLDDYTNKVAVLLGREPSIVFSAPDGAFTQGFRLEEDFSASDLLEWLHASARDAQMFVEGSTLFSSGKTTVQYEGQAYPSKEERVSVQNFTYLPVDKLVLDTKMKYDGSFERSVSFQLPQSTCDQLSATLEGYLTRLVPAGGKGEWSGLSTGRLFTVAFSARDAGELEEKTTVVLDTAAARASLVREQGNIFSKQLAFEETLDFSSFLSGRHGKTYVEYQFHTDNSSGLSAGQVFQNGAWVDASGYLESGGFSVYGDQSRLRLRLQSDVSYALDAMNLHMTKTGEGAYQRELQLIFAGPGARIGARQAVDYFAAKAVPGASVSQEGSDCTLKIYGGIPEINAALAAFFGEGNRITLQSSDGLKLFHKTAVQDSIDLTAFCEQAGFAGEISYLYTDETGTALINRVFSAGESATFSAEKRLLNRAFAGALGGSCLAALAALLAVFLVCRHRRQEKKPLTRNSDGKPLAPLNLVCPFCGAQLYNGMDYCTGCARPVDYLTEMNEEEEP